MLDATVTISANNLYSNIVACSRFDLNYDITDRQLSRLLCQFSDIAQIRKQYFLT